jgi:dGTP triphosphohydrolase
MDRAFFILQNSLGFQHVIHIQQESTAYPGKLIVLDFISGMTDNYLVSWLDQIFVPKNIT